jgi:hypothetical protein
MVVCVIYDLFNWENFTRQTTTEAKMFETFRLKTYFNLH